MQNRTLLFWGLVLLNFIDYYLTSRIILLGGEEANPFVLYAIQQFGLNGILYTKAPFILLFGYAVFFAWDGLRPSWQTSTENILRMLNWVFIAVNCYSLGVYSSYAS